jgi:zinc protease
MKRILFILFLILTVPAWAQKEDPFAQITYHQLPNGLKVVLSPNTKLDLVQVRVNVGAGMFHEKKENYGVSHLLEHVLFRNETLEDDMSYMQLIKEKEGEANGVTTWDHTSYFAIVNKSHAHWLIEIFHTMLLNPSLSAKHIETEKKTVLLEIGEPYWLNKFLGIDLTGLFRPPHLKQPTYWEKEFGVNFGHGFSDTEEQLATLRLTHAQVTEHYKDFYDPSNMQILISGGFDPQLVLNQINQLFGQHPTNGRGDLRPRYEAKLQDRPYYLNEFQNGTSRMTLGYQVVGISYTEKEVLNSYTEYLSHRLMKKLRNLEGETYTVSDRSDLLQGFGHFAISLESARSKFRETYKLVTEILNAELLKGKLSDEDIEEAKRLYLNSFTLWGDSIESLDRLSERMLSSNATQAEWETPHQILSSVSNEEYLEILKKNSKEKHRFEMLVQPEIFFHYDYMFLLGICSLAFFCIFRKALLRPFENDQVKWVRKVRYPPLKLVELGLGVIAYFIFIHAHYLLERFIFLTPAFQSLGLVGQYMNMVITSFVIIASFQAIISLVPRKLYFINDKLVIKSLSYFSKHIPKDKIQKISPVSPLKLKLSILPKLWNSCFYFDLMFWRAGLLIELNDGKCYFFSAKDSAKSAKELQSLIIEKKKSYSFEILEIA